MKALLKLYFVTAFLSPRGSTTVITYVMLRVDGNVVLSAKRKAAKVRDNKGERVKEGEGKRMKARGSNRQ